MTRYMRYWDDLFELPLRLVVTIPECCVTFSGVKLSIRSFVLFISLTQLLLGRIGHPGKDRLVE